jgi:hypothetical protein
VDGIREITFLKDTNVTYIITFTIIVKPKELILSYFRKDG